MAGVFIEAIKELKAEIEELKKQVKKWHYHQRGIQ
jgi:hypothetical protein